VTPLRPGLPVFFGLRTCSSFTLALGPFATAVALRLALE
jgi:hypothetical protein